jgi:hypothetical protein
MDTKTNYEFTPQERMYFERLQQDFNASVSAGIRLIMTQQDLQGQWRVKPDGSGLELPDATPAFPAAKSNPAELEKKVNGMA